MKNGFIIFLILTLITCGLFFFYKKLTVYSTTSTVFGHNLTISAEGLNSIESVKLSLERLSEIETEINGDNPDSKISKINNGERADASISRLITRVASLSAASDWAFSIMYKTSDVGKIVQNMSSLPFGNSPSSDLYIDVERIAIGYSIDEMMEVLRKNATVSANLIVDGCAIAVSGNKPYVADIHYPMAPASQSMATVELLNKTLITHEASINNSSVLDARTGLSASSGILSATVIHDVATDADILANILLTIGEDGLKLVEECGGSGFVVTNRMEVKTTKGFNFTTLNNNFLFTKED